MQTAIKVIIGLQEDAWDEYYNEIKTKREELTRNNKTYWSNNKRKIHHLPMFRGESKSRVYEQWLNEWDVEQMIQDIKSMITLKVEGEKLWPTTEEL